jgi:hypothetical protein
LIVLRGHLEAHTTILQWLVSGTILDDILTTNNLGIFDGHDLVLDVCRDQKSLAGPEFILFLTDPNP